ncbi:MAG: helix-turn-helix transcriptional regulator [Collinsella sp.]
MEVGNRIRRERQRLGISQEELSRRAYVSRPTLSHWETGRTLPDAQSLLVLSEIFGTSIDELVKGDVAEMEEMVDREARVAIGRTLALACVAVGAGVCLVAVSFTARYLVGSVAFYSMTLLGMVMGFTVIARAGERAVSAASAAGVLAELAAGKCAAADKVVLRERLAHEIARDGVRDPYACLALGAACAVDIACMLVWFATLIRPGLFA